MKYRDDKADIQIRVLIQIDNTLHVENISLKSLKKANKTAGFNQVDKRAVLTYQKVWVCKQRRSHKKTYSKRVC